MPPPTPKRPLKTPARVPIAASCSSLVARASAATGRHPAILDAVPRESADGGRRLGALLEPLRADPPATRDPHRRRRHPGADRRAGRGGGGARRRRGRRWRALSERFGLVGCVSGRRAEEARRLVGLDGIAYAGNHGLELLLPGERRAAADPSLAGRERDAAEFLAGARRRRARRPPGCGSRTRGRSRRCTGAAPRTRTAAESRAHEIAVEAGQAGLEPRWGRKVLELRPVGGGGKDAAVASLLAGDGARPRRLRRRRPHRPRRLPPPARAARARASWRPRSASASSRRRRRRSCAEESDLTVDGPAGWLAILEWLAA